MTNLKISIIVPVFNSEHYLEQCLTSLIQQSYKNIEIILVNDESTDSSPFIMQRFSKLDTRIKIVNQSNQGVSSSRNNGLLIATGDYIIFVDSDDWISATTCEKVTELINETDTDVVLWPYIKELPDSFTKCSLFNHNKISFSKEKIKQLIHRRFFGLIDSELSNPEKADSIVTVWGKAYRASIIRNYNIEFVDLTKIGTFEDGLFNIEFFKHTNTAIYIDQYLYHYRKSNNQSITSTYKEKLASQWKSLFNILENKIEKEKLDSSYTISLNNRIAFSIIGLGLNELSNSTSNIAKFKQVNLLLKDERYITALNKLSIKYLPLKWKLFFTFAKCKFSIGVFVLLNVIKKIIGQ
jgi:glycosyltransferase involved in cell wall biosynthesis